MKLTVKICSTIPVYILSAMREFCNKRYEQTGLKFTISSIVSMALIQFFQRENSKEKGGDNETK